MNKVLVSRKSDNWKTPKDIYDKYINNGWFDPCPYNENPVIDGLTIEWKEKNFVNPPYSQLKKWVEKSITEMKKDKIVHLLIPARTDTKAFKMLYENNAKFIFISGRLHFNDTKETAPFPSVIVVLDLSYTKPSFELKGR